MSRAGLRVLRNKIAIKTSLPTTNPKLGHNLGYVKFLSNGLKASRSGFSFSYKTTI